MAKKIKEKEIDAPVKAKTIYPKKAKAPIVSVALHQQGRRYTKEVVDKEAEALHEWLNAHEEASQTSVAYIGDFCYERGYNRWILNDFCARSEAFSCAYARARQWQERKFVNNTLNRIWEPSFAKYVMARICGDEWKQSWDREEDNTQQVSTIVINKIEKT